MHPNDAWLKDLYEAYVDVATKYGRIFSARQLGAIAARGITPDELNDFLRADSILAGQPVRAGKSSP